MLFFAFVFFHFKYARKTWNDKCLAVKECVPPVCEMSDQTKEGCFFKKKGYHEKDYIQEKETLLSAIILAISGIVMTSYWNIDAIYGRRWQYVCNLYKDFIISDQVDDDGNHRKKEILRANLCIDILDHAMWNSKQFRNFFCYEISKYYLALNNNPDLKQHFLAMKSRDIEGFKEVHQFMKVMSVYLIKKYDEKESIYHPIKMKFSEVRRTLSEITTFLDYPRNNVPNLEYHAPDFSSTNERKLDCKTWC
jgi:hypothetical protein